MAGLDLEKIRAEISKLMAETAYINKQNQWYVVIITASVILALGTIIKLFF